MLLIMHILPLYEFLLACYARDYKNTDIISIRSKDNQIRKKQIKQEKSGKIILVNSAKKRRERIDNLITEDVYKVIKSRINRIKNGTAPDWENDINHYEKLLPVPADFVASFRQYRNKVAGHASYERIHKLNLTEFIQKYHSYLFLLYKDLGEFWCRKLNNFPDFGDVTNFLSVLTKQKEEQKVT
ncbi:hypothetical protein [Thalassomonas viridans]|uniref:hypothetical protein n=1 Tax=Thalassomonas viridans TaxID=137584 RepID=UPI00069CBEF2|nr:hypothetical protein [Thalassomonas viridans]